VEQRRAATCCVLDRSNIGRNVDVNTAPRRLFIVLEPVQGHHLRTNERPASGLQLLQADQRLPHGIPRIAMRGNGDRHVECDSK
jgi:hypothetical protein